MFDHPAFAGEQDIVPLSGFSGALIALIRDATGRAVVRKAAQSAELSGKLLVQANRQAELSAMLGESARMPEVLRSGEADGCFWFDMPFISGRDGIKYLADASHSQVIEFSDKICSIVERLAEAQPSAAKFALGPSISAKVKEIDHKTGGEYSPLLSRLIGACDSLGITLPTTLVHGDLTLENMIVDRDGSIWLIDAIESPFSHYWLDLAKLFQDCEGRWFLHRKRTLSLGLSWELRQSLFNVARAMDRRYPDVHYLLLSLTFARILPYARTPQDREFLRRRVETFTDAFERGIETGT